MEPCTGSSGGGLCLGPGLPEYLLHYACFKKVQLAAVKEGIYNSQLPTFRAMERDNVLHKLSDDHCQSTTCGTRADFVEASLNPPTRPISVLNPRIQPIRNQPCPDVTETGKPPNPHYNRSEDIRRSRSIWSRYLDTPGLLADQPEARLFHKDNFETGFYRFDGVRVRKIWPVSRRVRLSFTSEPRLDARCRKQQQQPTPFEITGRYRHPQPVFYRDMSSHLWRHPTLRAEHPNPPVGKLTRKRMG